MGSSSSETTTTVMRYAPYVEEHHNIFLDAMTAQREVAIAVSPFASYTFDVIDEDFFGVGYLVSSFASLHDMFGKFMAGLDIETLWNAAVTAVLTPSEVQDHINAQKEILDAQVILKTLPNFQHKMRDINAVMSSSFVVGTAMIEDKKIKDLGVICTEAIAQLIPTAQKQWKDALDWNKGLITTYAKLMRDYFSSRMTTDEAHYKMKTDDLLWPFTVLDYERKGLKALSPVTKQAKKIQAAVGGPAMRVVTIISWTLQGAYIGSEIYPGWGTAIGAVVGFLVGLADAFLLQG
jgi:hypothetical protein